MTDSTAKHPHNFYMGILALIVLWMSVPGLSSIPAIDRDEARFAQTTVQMVETGDVIDLKFQDETRYKKPVGAYWAQAVPVALFTDTDQRKIWAHRLPSVLAALLAVLATYWGGVTMMGRRGAFISAGVLATSLLFVFESHIAKTDALLCAAAAIVLATVIRIRTNPIRRDIWIFWATLGASVLIKGPVIPAIVILSILSLFIWDRDKSLSKALLNPIGIGIFFLIVLPWFMAITMKSGGDFWAQSLGMDFGAKITGAQENHGGLPGYYLTTLPLLFWPGSLLLVCGLVFGINVARTPSEKNQTLIALTRLLLVWTLPFWLILELVPTKLPNYLLPVYPALALLCGGAVLALTNGSNMPRARKVGAALFFVTGVIILAAILSAEAMFSDTTSWVRWLFIVALFGIYWATGAFWRGNIERGLKVAAVTALVITPLTYGVILPSLDDLFTSKRLEQAINDVVPRNIRATTGTVFSPTFTEPSLVYHLGTNIVLGDKVPPLGQLSLAPEDILIIDEETPSGEAFMKNLATPSLEQTLCHEEIARVGGTNYSKGDAVDLAVLRFSPCEVEPVIPALNESR